MRIQTILASVALGVALTGHAFAGDLKPIQSQSIDLGGVAGDAYYTVQKDGFHVVATFAQRDPEATPVRFQAVLLPGQAVTFSTPRSVGEQPVSFSIKRQDERVVVSTAELTN
jgi:hypothetical protein